MITPCRGAFQLSETLKLMVRDPLPDCPASIVIQGASGLAVQVQPGWVVIVVVRVYDADMQGVSSTGATEYSQLAGRSPACVTVNVRSPAVIVAVRLVTFRFLSTEYETLPLPVPGLPPVTLSHAALLVADHGQPSGALIAKLPDASSLSNDALLGEMSTAQGTRPWTCTATDSPATVSVPVRTAPVGFEETVTLTVPAPLPLAPLVMDIQPRSDVAVHVQWLAALTVTELEPPDASNDRDDAESAYVHGPGVGSVGELLLQPSAAAASTADSAR
jgi:hypothetical protein